MRYREAKAVENVADLTHDAVEGRITELAAGQHGVVTYRQLLQGGLTPRQVEWRVRSKRLRRLHRGVYLLGYLHGPLQPARAREVAAVLACGEGAAASHRSAGWLRELAPRPPNAAPVDVTVPAARTAPRRAGIRVHRATLAPDDIDEIDGIPVTSVARTLRDLAACLDGRALERAVARAERAGLIGPRDLERLVERHAGGRGIRRLRAIIRRAGGAAFTRSEAEALFLELIRDAGLPPPRVNVVVLGYELDFLWPEAGIAVEVDGFAYHGSRPSFRSDRQRDGDLQAAGVRVVHVMWEQIVDTPLRTLVMLTRILEQAGGFDRP